MSVHPKALRAPIYGIFTALFLALPAVAGAQTPTNDVYDPEDVRQVVSSAGSAATKSASSSSSSSGLAFTGLDVWLVVLAGIVILLTGLAIRRATRLSE